MNDVGLVPGFVLFALAALAGGVVVSGTARRNQAPDLQVRLFLVAITLRFGASLAIYAFGLVDFLLDEDASGWRGGTWLYQGWLRERIGFFDLPFVLGRALHHPFANDGYRYLLGGLFWITDAPARLPAAVLNNLFGALTVVLVYRIAATLFSPWVARRVGLWACLMPSLVMWSAQTLKEPVVIFLETAALAACVRIKRSGHTREALVCVAAIVLLLPFRFYAAYLTTLATVGSLALRRLQGRRKTLGLALLIGVLVSAALVTSGLLAQHEAFAEHYGLTEIQALRDYTARTAGSGVVLPYDLRTPSGFAASVVIGAGHLLLAPFPWQIAYGSARMLLTVPDVILWWWLVFTGLVPGLRVCIRWRFDQVQPLLFFALGMTLLYSLFFSNVGLVYRQRAQLLPWLLIFAMVGLEQRRLARRRMAVDPGAR